MCRSENDVSTQGHELTVAALDSGHPALGVGPRLPPAPETQGTGHRAPHAPGHPGGHWGRALGSTVTHKVCAGGEACLQVTGMTFYSLPIAEPLDGDRVWQGQHLLYFAAVSSSSGKVTIAENPVTSARREHARRRDSSHETPSCWKQAGAPRPAGSRPAQRHRQGSEAGTRQCLLG